MCAARNLGLPPEVQLNHPHDFFSLRHYAVVPNTCFVLMPFARKFNKIYTAITGALNGVMECTRADDFAVTGPASGEILDRIMRGIATAELIIADLTGRNPNVFYELGLAHVHSKNVLLLTQRMRDVPFDLRGLFCHVYNPLPRGRAALVNLVYKATAAVRARSIPTLLENPLQRTAQIVKALAQLQTRPDRLQRTVIRHQAGLSSLSNIATPPTAHAEMMEYDRLLEEERRLMIECVKGGASLQLMLVPVLTPWRDVKRWRARWDRVIEFLCDDECMKRCDVVLSPVGGTNLLFLGEDILFEGHKTAIERGFGLTVAYTNRSIIIAKMRIFDGMFESARQYMLQYMIPPGTKGNERQRLRKAVIAKIMAIRDHKGVAYHDLLRHWRDVRDPSRSHPENDIATLTGRQTDARRRTWK